MSQLLLFSLSVQIQSLASTALFLFLDFLLSPCTKLIPVSIFNPQATTHLASCYLGGTSLFGKAIWHREGELHSLQLFHTVLWI